MDFSLFVSLLGLCFEFCTIPFQLFPRVLCLSFIQRLRRQQQQQQRQRRLNEQTGRENERGRESEKKHIGFILIEYNAIEYLPLSCVPYSM